MFRKPYKVKTSTTMKGSERRTLRNLVETRYPNLSQEDINNLVPNKGEMNQVKAMAHGGRTFMIYYSNLEPIFFLVENILYPSIYTLWKYTDLLPTITTVPPVLEKICNGADLMAPGVVINETIIQEMRDFKVNDVCTIKILGNKAPIAVGVAIMSAKDLCSDGIKGKAVTITHNYKDNLWSSGSGKELPELTDQQFDICEEIEDLCISADNTTLCETDIIKESDSREDDSENTKVNEDLEVSEMDNKCVTPSYTMDEILYQSFMAALKKYGKKIDLPLLTSTFYSSYVLKSCPPELNLDIKKTTHKKTLSFP